MKLQLHSELKPYHGHVQVCSEMLAAELDLRQSKSQELHTKTMAVVGDKVASVSTKAPQQLSGMPQPSNSESQAGVCIPA